MIRNLIVLGVLAVAAYRDWKEQNVYLYLPFAAGIAGILCYFHYQNPALPELAGGLLTGMAVLGIALLGRNCIGAGDGMMFMVSGIFLGYQKNLQLLLISSLLAGLVALFLLVVKKKERSMRMPFLPFMLAAYLMQLL